MPQGPTVVPSAGPPRDPWTLFLDYESGTSLIYQGWAKSSQTHPTKDSTLTVVSVSAASDASIVVTAHGLAVGNRITISGATGDWAFLNGNHAIKAITDADTFTIEASSSGFAGTFAGVITTQAPRTSVAQWAIQKLYYSGTTMVRMSWAGGTSADNQIWDNRATLSYQ